MTRYELLERIGAGRMAEIFRGKAVAAGGFEKPVAIKRILPHLSQDRRFVELLIAEAKILSALRHRNIVQIFDVGLGEDGAYFLVMEYVDGVDLGVLERVLERRRARLPIDLVLHIGAEVCDALDHAQQTPTPDGRPMGLVHRDVSPSNVLVSRAGEVKLTDFGLARRPDDRRTAGGLRGRFGYVSPEQVAGQPVDGRSDVFSLGVLVWELAVGKRLFSGMADYEALRAITDVPIPPPSTQDRGLPGELDAILAEALSRDLERRLPSAGELGKRLRGLRYSLESSSGDPAAALARMLTGVEREPLTLPSSLAAEGLPMAPPFDSAERSVVKIRTAEVFAQRDPDGTGLLEARRLLEAFEDAETRMSSLPVAFDDISSTGGHSLRAIEERTELTAAPMHLDGDAPRDTSEVALAGERRDTAEVASDTGEVMRDTGETSAIEAPTRPAPSSSSGAAGSLISTIRGGGAVPVPAWGTGGPGVARTGPGAEPPAAAKPVDTVRGGQVAPLASPARGRTSSAPPSARDPAAVAIPARPGPRETPGRAAARDASGPVRAAPPKDASTPVRAASPKDASGPVRAASPKDASGPVRAAPPKDASAAARVERRLADWRDRSESSVDSDWTEKTPPPPMPPSDADPPGGASLIGSLSSLPSLGALSPGQEGGRPLPGLSPSAFSIHTAQTLPPSGARSPFAAGASASSLPSASASSLASASASAASPFAPPAASPFAPPAPAASPFAPPASPFAPPTSAAEPLAAPLPPAPRAPAPGAMPASSSPGIPLPASARGPGEHPGSSAHPGRDEAATDPSRSYPPAGSAPWGWMPTPAPRGAAAALRRWWPVGLGALAIAILSFVITQAAIDPEVAPVRALTPIDAPEAGAGVLDATDLAPAAALDASPAVVAVDAGSLDPAAAMTDDAGAALDAAGATPPGLDPADAGAAIPTTTGPDGGAATADGSAAPSTPTADGSAAPASPTATGSAPAAATRKPAATSKKPSRPSRRDRDRDRDRARTRRRSR